MARKVLSREMGFAIVLSLGAHVVWLAREAKASFREVSPPAEVILEAYEAKPPPLPEPPAVEPETKAQDNPKPEPVVQKSVARVAAQQPPLPAAAQAGKTLTAPDDATSDVADFTMVQGSGTEYVGGTTSAIGTNKNAVRGAASQKPVTATSVVPRMNQGESPGKDLSRSPRPEGTDWNCSRLFPQDADAPDSATVSIVVTVSANGTPKAVTVLRDPGHGFGAAARVCAMSQRYSSGLDRQGLPTVAMTPPITVRFTR